MNIVIRDKEGRKRSLEVDASDALFLESEFKMQQSVLQVR